MHACRSTLEDPTGFTYLWFGLQIIFGLEPEGFGWYSAFVAAIAAYHAVTTVGTDPVFAVIWATWAIMWALFFVLLGLGRTQVGGFDLGRFTGWFLVWLGVPTCTVSALFLLEGRWSTSPVAGAGALLALVALTVLSVALTRAGLPGRPAADVARETAGTEPGAERGAAPGDAPGAERRDAELAAV